MIGPFLASDLLVHGCRKGDDSLPQISACYLRIKWVSLFTLSLKNLSHFVDFYRVLSSFNKMNTFQCWRRPYKATNAILYMWTLTRRSNGFSWKKRKKKTWLRRTAPLDMLMSSLTCISNITELTINMARQIFCHMFPPRPGMLVLWIGWWSAYN